MTLTEFLLARIAEREALARSAPTDPLGVIDYSLQAEAHRAKEKSEDAAPALLWAAQYVSDLVERYRPKTLHDPARVLTECEAKRRIVAKRLDISDMDLNDDGLNGEAIGLDFAIRVHAAIYADHPDYREEWKP